MSDRRRIIIIIADEATTPAAPTPGLEVQVKYAPPNSLSNADVAERVERILDKVVTALK